MVRIFNILVEPKSRFSSFLSVFIAVFKPLVKLLKSEYIENHEKVGFLIFNYITGPPTLKRRFCKKITFIFKKTYIIISIL